MRRITMPVIVKRLPVGGMPSFAQVRAGDPNASFAVGLARHNPAHEFQGQALRSVRITATRSRGETTRAITLNGLSLRHPSAMTAFHLPRIPPARGTPAPYTIQDSTQVCPIHMNCALDEAYYVTGNQLDPRLHTALQHAHVREAHGDSCRHCVRLCQWNG